MNHPTCSRIRRLVDDGTELRGDAADHASSCRACSSLLARARALERLLASLPAAPRATFGPPPSAGARPRRLVLRPPLWTAAAAAAVVAAAWAWTAREDGRVHVERVVDVADAPPQVDEPLLALTGGAEAVAMRRPTEMR
jgi:hypothetical protein